MRKNRQDEKSTVRLGTGKWSSVGWEQNAPEENEGTEKRRVGTGQGSALAREGDREGVGEGLGRVAGRGARLQAKFWFLSVAVEFETFCAIVPFIVSFFPDLQTFKNFDVIFCMGLFLCSFCSAIFSFMFRLRADNRTNLNIEMNKKFLWHQHNKRGVFMFRVLMIYVCFQHKCIIWTQMHHRWNGDKLHKKTVAICLLWFLRFDLELYYRLTTRAVITPVCIRLADRVTPQTEAGACDAASCSRRCSARSFTFQARGSGRPIKALIKMLTWAYSWCFL